METRRDFLAVKLANRYEVYQVVFSPLLEQWESTYTKDDETGVSYTVYWRSPNPDLDERLDVTRQVKEYMKATFDNTGHY